MDKDFYKNLPEIPGIYLMKDAQGQILYIGKAGNLKRRVSSYFVRPRLRQGYGGQAHDSRIEQLVRKVARVEHRSTDTVIEALVLESELIKRYQPPFNVREKDDKSFLHVATTKEAFPRVLLVRGRDMKRLAPGGAEGFGPFTSSSSIREALRILRKIFPWSVHSEIELKKITRPCLDYQIGLCPGVCIGMISSRDYARNIRNIKVLLQGKRKKIIDILQREMRAASGKLEFETAEKIKRQIFALQHVQDVALISEDAIRVPESGIHAFRLEGYDVSNISGTSAVGAMAVFEGERRDTQEYRKFKMNMSEKPNDVGMLKEMLRRRFAHKEWRFPDAVLVDGGVPQVNAARTVLRRLGITRIPVIGIAKGARRKKNEMVGSVPPGVSERTLIQARDEAHRFAVRYHKMIRGRRFLAHE